MLTINEEGQDHYFGPCASILISVLLEGSLSSRPDIKMRRFWETEEAIMYC